MSFEIEMPKLTNAALCSLFRGGVKVLLVRNFCELELCDDLSAYFLYHRRRKNFRYLHATRGLVESSVERVGPSFNSIYKSIYMSSGDGGADIAAYETERDEEKAALRLIAEGRLLPIDRLRLELDEEYDDGATVAKFRNVRAYTGIARIQASQGNVPNDPHVDWLPRLALALDAQYSAIVYLAVPSEGGELELWDVPAARVTNELREDGTLDRQQLPEPTVIKPRKGDLIIINSRQPHAVRNFDREHRIAQTCFIGHRPSLPLQLWS